MPTLGLTAEQAPAIYLTCEDDDGQLHFRQAAICEAMGVRMEDLDGRLHIRSLRGADNALASFDSTGRFVPAPLFHRLADWIRRTGARLVALDNVGHLFDGNENDRREVTRFVNLLNRLAGDTGAAILLLAHPNKAGDSFSGSTAWLNAVRSQFTLSRPDAEGADPDQRTVTVGKANYATAGEAITFRWHNWAFVRDDDLPADQRAELAQVIRASRENDVFMACLAAATASRRAVSHNPGVNYFATVFARMPEAKGTTRGAFEAAFERLLHLGKIELDAALWQDAHRHWKQGIRAVENCGNPPAATPCGEARLPLPETRRNPCGNPRAATPLYTTYMTGGAEGGPPPIEKELNWGGDQ